VARVPAEVGATANRYQILGKLAAGGMAEIFLARGASATGLVRYCVLKRILRERSRDAEFVRMFLDEARLAAQLQHPNIAQVYDLGMLGDSYFFTMEYVHGETVRSLLHRALSRQRSLPLACVLTVIAGAAGGLHHAHDRMSNDGRRLGIVHRDVSPSNLMVSYEGNVKILDFGVAKAADRGVETKSGTVKGKISYLSPEQCRGERVDRRSDLFSLGIVMWEMLAGARLYRRASDFENMTAIVHEAPRPPSSRRSEVPRAVDDIVMRLLAKSVAERFQTAGEVVEAIENASMRAGTILSTSALSRLIHDLFGARAEPWLELDTETVPHPRMTLASSPLPGDLGVPVDPVELELAAVPDLSVSQLLDDEFDPGSSSAESVAFEPQPAAPLPVAVQRSSPIPVPVAATPFASTRAMLEAIASAIPAGPANVTTLLGVSAPANAAAMATIRQKSASLATVPTTTVRDLSAAAAAETTLRDAPGALAGHPIDTPTYLSPAGASVITPTQVSPWPPGNATPSRPFDAPRLGAATAPNPVITALDHIPPAPRLGPPPARFASQPPAASAPNPIIDHGPPTPRPSSAPGRFSSQLPAASSPNPVIDHRPSMPRPSSAPGHFSSRPPAASSSNPIIDRGPSAGHAMPSPGHFGLQPPAPHPGGFAALPAAPSPARPTARPASRFTPALIAIMIAAAATGAIAAWLAMRTDPRDSQAAPPATGSAATSPTTPPTSR
jgi:serine/threonine protein kinase